MVHPPFVGHMGHFSHHCPSHPASGVPVMHPHLWELMPQTDEDSDEEQDIQDPDYFNLLISEAILFPGGSPVATNRMFKHIKICMILARTFFNYQRCYLVRAINMVDRYVTRLRAVITASEHQKQPLLAPVCYSLLHCLFAQVWSQQKEELFAELQGRDVDLAGDGRCDSLGSSAKYLTYSIHVVQLNKTVHFEQVQVGELSHTFLSAVQF